MDRTRNFLLVVTALCLAAALPVYLLILAQQHALLDEVQENPLWAAHQLERESHDFGMLLDEMRQHPSDTALAESLRLRFDILYSRLSVVSYGQLGAVFDSIPETGEALVEVRRLMNEMDKRVYAELDGPTLEALQLQATELTGLAGNFLLDTLKYGVQAKTERRATLARLVDYLGLLIVLVAVGTALLVYILVRQVRGAQRAHGETLTLAETLERSAERTRRAGLEQAAFMQALDRDLRSRLERIRDSAERLLRSPLDEVQHRDALGVEEGCTALFDVIESVGELALLTSADYVPGEQAFNLRSLLAGLVDEYRPAAADRHLSFGLQLAPEAGGTYIGDVGRLRQALAGLLDNAIRFTPEGSVRLRVEAEQRSDEFSELRFEVEDSGIGLDENAGEGVFRPFGRAGAADGGAGMGLAICRAIVEKMDGHIGVDSVPGQGARFWFRVSLHRLAAPLSSAGTEPDGEPPEGRLHKA